MRGDVCIRNKGRGTVRDRSALLSAPVFLFKSPSVPLLHSLPREATALARSDFIHLVSRISLGHSNFIRRDRREYINRCLDRGKRGIRSSRFVLCPIVNIYLKIGKKHKNRMRP